MTPIGYLGFSLTSGETLLLPQGTPFQLVRAVEDTLGDPRPPVNGGMLAHTRATATRKAAVKAPKTPLRRSGGKAPAADLERYRKAVESKGLSVAAEELGVNYNTLYYQAKRGGWKLPKSAPRAKEAVTSPKRRCEQCEKLTVTDPCSHCSTPWSRSK